MVKRSTQASRPKPLQQFPQTRERLPSGQRPTWTRPLQSSAEDLDLNPSVKPLWRTQRSAHRNQDEIYSPLDSCFFPADSRKKENFDIALPLSFESTERLTSTSQKFSKNSSGRCDGDRSRSNSQHEHLLHGVVRSVSAWVDFPENQIEIYRASLNVDIDQSEQESRIWTLSWTKSAQQIQLQCLIQQRGRGKIWIWI